MNRNCLLNKLLAMLLCAVLLIGYLPVSALPAAAATDDKWESEKDVLETRTEAPTEPETTVPEVEETTEPEAPETTEPEVEETTVPEVEETTEPEVESEPVKYVIWSAADNKAMTALDSNKTFGYLPATDVTPDDYYAPVGYGIANIFTLIQNGENYYIVDSQGRYLYMTGTYNSYNVSETLPTEGAEWKLNDLGDGTYHITNVLKSKTVSYGSSYGTFAAYANEPFSAMTLYEIPGYTADNPVFLFDIEKTVVNDGTMYYATRHSGCRMVISGEGDFSINYNGEVISSVYGFISTEVYSANPFFNPVVFELTGDGDYTIEFIYPAGHANNPATATLGDNVATIESGSGEYFFNYTAEYTGKLLVEISSADGKWQYTVNNLTTLSYGETQWSDSDPVVNPAEIDVTEGDIIEIKVITYDPADMWNIPAGEITVNLAYKPGSCEAYPILLLETANMVTNVGTMYYGGYFSGMFMSIAGEGEFSVIYNGETLPSEDGCVWTLVSAPNPRMPVTFAIVGDGDYTITFAYPVGSMSNPATATLGDNVATIESGSGEYFFNYTAEYTGKLLVEIGSADGNWQYTINNMTTYQYGETQWSDSDPVVNPAEIDVTEGDIIEIKVITYDPAEMWNIPAGEITVNLAYKPGSCEAYPIWLQDGAIMVTNVGTMYYGCYFSGTTMIVTGSGEFSVIYNGEVLTSVGSPIITPISSPNPRMPVTFALVGDGDYVLHFAYPEGTQMHPAVAVIGENVCDIEAGNSQGYFWTYTAEQTGELVIAIKASTGWTYAVNNLTTGQYGDTQWSDSDPVVNPATIAVNEGDEIQIIVNTYDPADMWSNPAGEITLGLAYLPIPDGWVMEGSQWCYYIDGQKLTNGWAQDSSGWYYMGADGYAVKNTWAMSEGGWMYIGSDKHPVKNAWTQDSSGWYYMGADGYAVKNMWVMNTNGWMYIGSDKHPVRNDWAQDSVGWYFMGADGYAVKNAWTKDSSGWYYMGYHGRAVQNEWAMNEGGWMYLGSDKHPVKNAWTKDGAGIYYMGADGYAVKNTWAMNTKGWMYIGSNKHPVINDWAQDSAGWYFMGGDGYAVKNAWTKDSSGWYYMDETGRAVKNGWAKDSAGKLYMGADGHAVKNTWITVGGKKYFADANGYIVTGTQSIGGKLYTFDANGVLIG